MLESWGNEFYVTGGAEWGCSEGVIMRRVSNVEWLDRDGAGLSVARLTTTKAQYPDLFEHAHINLKQLAPSSQPNPQDVVRRLLTAKRSEVGHESIPFLKAGKMVYHDAYPMLPEVSAAAGGPVSSLFKASKPRVTVISPIEYDVLTDGDLVGFSWSYEDDVSEDDYWEIKLSSGKRGNERIIYQKNLSDPNARDFFETLTTSEAGNDFRVQVTLRKKDGSSVSSAARGPYYVNKSPSLVISSPKSTDSFQSGSEIVIEWDYDDQVIPKQKVELQLCTYDNGLVSCSKKANVDITSKKHTHNCDKKMNKDGTYFWRIKYKGGYTNGKIFSYYHVDDVKEDLYIISPMPNNSYKSGDAVKLTWDHRGFEKDATVSIELCRERWLVDKTHQKYSKNVNAIAGEVSVELPAGLPDSTKYYFKIAYTRNEGYKEVKRSAESKRFAINHNAKFIFTSPKWNDVVDPGEISVTWETNLTEKVRLSLCKRIPVSFDPEIVSEDVSPGDERHIFNVREGTFFPVYFSVKYDCKMFNKYVCKEEVTPTFIIPDRNYATWNYDEKKNAIITNPYPIYSYSCETCENKNAEIEKKICDFCKKWNIKSNIDLTCNDCYAKADCMLYDLDLRISIGKIVSCILRVNGEVLFEIGRLEGNFNLKFEDSREFTLANVPKKNFRFSIGPIPVSVDIKFDAKMTIAPKFTTALALNASFSQKMTLNSGVEYGTTTRNGVYMDITRAPGITKPDLQIVGNLNASADVGLKATLGVTLYSICTLSATLNPILTPSLSLSYPPFLEEVNASTNNTCSEPHYAKYGLGFKLNTGATANILFAGPSKGFTIFNTSFGPSSLLHGCFLPERGTNPSLTINLTAPLKEIFPINLRGSVLMALAHEIAEFVGINPSVVRVTEDKSESSLNVAFITPFSSTAKKYKDPLLGGLNNPDSQLRSLDAFRSIKKFYKSSN